LQRLDQDAQHLARHEQRMAFIVYPIVRDATLRKSVTSFKEDA
jgi:hypothetical protein